LSRSFLAARSHTDEFAFLLVFGPVDLAAGKASIAPFTAFRIP
jgi:hypothetical protein